jgi:hypothetical protein
MAPGADPLAALRDIRLPEPTQWDALADAAMAFAAGLLVALAVVMLARALMRRRQSRREAALVELEATRRLAGKNRLIAQANLLRRLASQMPVATGDASALHWTARLDRETGTDFFTAGAGAGLREALYRRDAEIDPERIDRQLVLLLQTVKD